jgi:hypothetical protein
MSDGRVNRFKLFGDSGEFNEGIVVIREGSARVILDRLTKLTKTSLSVATRGTLSVWT